MPGVKQTLGFLVLLVFQNAHAATTPDFGGPPAHSSPHSQPHKPSSTASSHSSHSSSASAVFSTPPASLSVPAAFTAGVFFSTDFLKEFYPGFGPTQTSVEPQPVITDIVLHSVFPLELTNPKTIPTANINDPVVLPPSLLEDSPVVVSPKKNLSTPGSIALRQAALSDISAILSNSTGSFSSSCGQCISSLSILKQLALTAPWEVPPALISICHMTKFSAFGSCEAEFSANSDGQMATQVLAFADVTGVDGELMCAKDVIPLRKSCPTPPPADLSELLKTWFKKPKPANAVAPKPSGKERIKVLHLSDFHIDPRYTVGSEASCDQFLCCRPDSNTSSVPPGQIKLAAPRFGSFECDTPWMLANAVMHAIGPLTGIKPTDTKAKKPTSFTVFTGDLTSHDNDNQLSRAYVEYVETSVYQLFKEYLGGPVYAALGNHDTWPQAFDAPHNLQPEQIANQFQWNYDHLAELWEAEGWISEQVAETAKKTYSAYSVVTPFGLKVITLNTDFWYVDNWFNMINSSNPDNSGMLSFLTDELQAAEDAGQRVWIVGHVLSGWDGSAAFANPTNLLYHIIDRFSPHVISNIMMGHIHDEVRYIYYSNNATVMNASTALTTTWVGGSVTPLSGLNSGFSMYEVDPETFDIMDAFVWFANVSSFPELDHEHKTGASYNFEYSTREAYGGGFEWPEDAPLNATWWHLVTESMETNPSLLQKFTLNQGRQSTLTQNCTSTECQEAKICYMRSGSPPIAARCARGFSSVQE